MGNKGYAKDLKTLYNHASHYIPLIEGYYDASPLNNLAIARFLYLQWLRDLFDLDKDGFCCNVQNRTYSSTCNVSPSLFYPETEYDPHTKEKSPLCSPFLVLVSKYFFYSQMHS